MKKFICLLSVIFAVSAVIFPLTACADKKPSESRSVTDAANPAAELTIYTFDGKPESEYGIVNLGHAFLGFKNLSREVIDIGVPVAPGEEVTFGTWSIAEHFGVWYNVESNYILNYNKYYGRQSIEKLVSLEDAETIRAFIFENDLWTPLKNCTWFAVNLWNAVSAGGDRLDTPLIYSPAKLKEDISCFNKVKTNKSVFTSESIVYITGSGPEKFSMKEAGYAG